MGQESEAIKRHIDAQREQLGENLQDLEARVKSAKDWRAWVRRKPLGLAAAAFGIGLALAIKMGR